MIERKMSDVEKAAEQCRAWAQQIINDGTSSQAGPDASDMLAMAATLDALSALSALGGWDEAIGLAIDVVTGEQLINDFVRDRLVSGILSLRRPATGEG